MSTIKLGVIGADGRMGVALREHIATVEDIEVVATLEQGESLAGFIAAQPGVVVDLSLGEAVAQHGAAVVKAGIPYIIGASGLSEDTVSAITQANQESGSQVLLAPNFSIGANLMIRCASQAAALMGSPVITERHHAGKLDAPSGTAKLTAERIAEARSSNPDADYSEQVPGVMGGTVAGVPVHSVRGEGYLAEQQVQFSLPGETLTIEHSSIDRRCFMPGIVYAIRNIRQFEGFVSGLGNILDIKMKGAFRKWDGYDLGSRSLSLIEELISDEQKQIFYSDTKIEYFEQFADCLAENGITIIWVDRLRPMKCKQDIFNALDVALGYYATDSLNWDCFDDLLDNEDWLPGKHCIFYFTELDNLKKHDRKSFQTLIEILESTSRYYQGRVEGYSFRSLIVM